MEQNRYYSLDFLKIIATIGILFHHYQQLSGLKFDTGINYYFGWFDFSTMVELFYIISGFLALRSIDKEADPHFGKWLLKKWLRLIPLVAISVLVFDVLDTLYIRFVGSPFMGVTPSLWGSVITMIGVQDGWFFHNPSINNPVWYISDLILCYVIFCFIIRLFKKHEKYAVLGFIAMIIIGCIGLKYKADIPFLRSGSPRAYISFFTGSIIGLRSKNKTITYPVQIISLLAIAAGGYLIITHNRFIECGMTYFLTFFFYPALILFSLSDPIKRILNHKILGTISFISYNVYIWHICCYMILIIALTISNHSETILHSRLSMYLYAFCCFLAGTLSRYILEKPIQRFVSSKTSLKT